MKRLFNSLYLRAALLGALALSLVGCEAEPSGVITQDKLRVQLRVVPGLETRGLAVWQEGECQILLREYPQCLLHEVRHCIEGDWHKGRETDEDCF